MPKFRNRPTECEAMRWDAPYPAGGRAQLAERIVAWVNANGGEARYDPEQKHYDEWAAANTGAKHPARIAVRTINGWAYAAPGHYVVMGSTMFLVADGRELPAANPVRDFYPCDPETFEKRWVPAGDTDNGGER